MPFIKDRSLLRKAQRASLIAKRAAQELAKDIGAVGAPTTGGMVSTPTAGGGKRRKRPPVV
jgi:hypothetical protein